MIIANRPARSNDCLYEVSIDCADQSLIKDPILVYAQDRPRARIAASLHWHLQPSFEVNLRVTLDRCAPKGGWLVIG